MKTVALVGLGLIGQERLKAITALKKCGFNLQVKGLLDPNVKETDSLASAHHAVGCARIEDIIAVEPDLVIVSVPHHLAAEITCHLLRANLNVLLEKPLGRKLSEARLIANSCLRPDQLFVGQNYRFFPGISQLARDIGQGRFGKPIGLSLLLGHGGKPEDRQSWKLDPNRAGSGSLLDPGIHLLDLCHFLGDKPEPLSGLKWSGFWDTGIDEECRVLLRGSKTPMIDITVSVARWRSTFRCEYYGEDGYGLIHGRGKSYGCQEYRRGLRWGWSDGKSQIESEESVITSECENSLTDELQAILFPERSDVLAKPCNSAEALANMQLLENIEKTVQSC
jgi:predicted dehydrogenase